MTTDRPKPASFGFDADFSDLSTVKPATRTQITKTVGATPATQSPKPAKPKPKSKAAKTAKPKLATQSLTQNAKIPAVLKERDHMADKLAQSLGFESREQKPLVLKKRRRTHHDEPVDQLSIRGPVRVLNSFITYCETHHLSYWEAMEQLLEKR